MTSSYFKELDDISKARYLRKLMHEGNSLPDPLDDATRCYVFSDDVRLWPSIVFGDIYMYLVEKECVYTKDAFKNYKALDCYNYFLSGKIKNILTWKNANLNICVVTCSVQSSQTIKSFHHPWIVASMNGYIYSGHCTCMAGLGEVCSHIAALLFAIEIAKRENVEKPSVTSLPCVWNKTAKEVKSSAAAHINFFHKRKNPYKRDIQHHSTSSMPSTSAYNTFLGVVKVHQPSAAIFEMLSSEEDTSTASEAEAESEGCSKISTNKMPNLFDHFRRLNLATANISAEDQIKFFYINTKFSADYIADVEYSTRLQIQSPMWNYQRRGRITSSLFGRVLKCKTGQKGLIATIMQKTKQFSNDAMKYGQINEIHAKKKLMETLKDQHVNAELICTGFMIDKQYGFLGATPDGMVVCDCCCPALVEVKCPARGKGLKISSINNRTFFLDQNLNLKLNHPYYDQIQGQMDIWNMSKCYFVTYTDKDIHIQLIEYDSEYWSFQKPHIITFFKKYILPQILKKL